MFLTVFKIMNGSIGMKFMFIYNDTVLMYDEIVCVLNALV